jgi:hypothetical protein
MLIERKLREYLIKQIAFKLSQKPKKIKQEKLNSGKKHESLFYISVG